MIDVHAYCRDVEAHLCRRNDGHLIRIVGPAFELVKGWADTGIPLSVVRDGIDRTVARAARRTTVRRRPLRIEFCEADVLDGFDRWRRAVGVAAVAEGASPRQAVPKRGALAAHVESAAAHLTALLTAGRGGPALQAAAEGVLTALGPIMDAAGAARGAARDALIAELAALDARLLEAAERDCPAGRLSAHAAEAARELEPFRGRLTAEQWTAAASAARARALRRDLGLPDVRFD
ncbi:MAG: hypothetical protein AB7O28_02930 [Vicinamibacterales bacterium]